MWRENQIVLVPSSMALKIQVFPPGEWNGSERVLNFATRFKTLAC